MKVRGGRTRRKKGCSRKGEEVKGSKKIIEWKGARKKRNILLRGTLFCLCTRVIYVCTIWRQVGTWFFVSKTTRRAQRWCTNRSAEKLYYLSMQNLSNNFILNYFSAITELCCSITRTSFIHQTHQRTSRSIYSWSLRNKLSVTSVSYNWNPISNK